MPEHKGVFGAKTSQKEVYAVLHPAIFAQRTTASSQAVYEWRFSLTSFISWRDKNENRIFNSCLKPLRREIQDRCSCGNPVYSNNVGLNDSHPPLPTMPLLALPCYQVPLTLTRRMDSPPGCWHSIQSGTNHGTTPSCCRSCHTHPQGLCCSPLIYQANSTAQSLPHYTSPQGPCRALLSIPGDSHNPRATRVKN